MTAAWSVAWAFPAAVIGGAAVGAGLFLMLWQAVPGTPALGPALRRLHPPTGAAVGAPAGGRFAALTRVVSAPTRDLAVLGRTRGQYAASLLVSGLVGLALPGVLGAVAAVAGVPVPLFLPVAAALGCGALFALIAHRDVRARAARARTEISRGMAVYLDLVALELAAARGPVQALEQAAAVCRGPVFDRIQDALAAAAMQLRPPWQELRRLGEELGVPELGDVGAVMESAGADGAHVRHTLRQRAGSLRNQLRTAALADAEAVTARLDIPGAALVFVLTAFVLYPFITRV